MTASRVFLISLLMLTVLWAKPIWAKDSSNSATQSDDATLVRNTTSDVSPDWKKKEVKVPNVVGLWRDEAILDVFKAGLRIGDIREETSTSVAHHHVISESPNAGTQVKEASKVDLVISRAPEVKVPDVVGLTLAAAKARLDKVDLNVGRIEEKQSSTVAAGLIIIQHPRAGTTVREDRRVRLVVSKGASQVTVPNVIGATQAAAATAITGAGLTVGTVISQSSATVVAGLVISESPAAGSTVTLGSAVNLVVSTGAAKVTVPNVVGLTQAAATTAITGAGLAVGSVATQSSSTVAAGLVISENPFAGSSVAANSAVNFVVSTGVAKVAVPNVVGQTQSAATTVITAAGLKIGTVTTQSSPTMAAGLVISESPPAGTSVITGSAVNLVLSTGMVLVPNVVGMTQAAATTSITSAGLKLGTVATQTSTTVVAGLVISESPAVGTTVTLASSINLVVSSGGQSIPTAIGASVPAAASGLITTFYSASTTVAVGGAIPTLPDGSVPVLFAGDGVNDPLLLAVGSITGTLDASSTAIGLVRMALGVVVSQAPLTSAVLASAIQASPHYVKLLTDVNASLTTGQSPLDSETVPQDAIQVAQDAIVTLNTNGTLASDNAKIKAAAAPIQINPPLPYYFIKGSEPYNQLWLTDNPGTMTVNAMNQTFIAWQFDTADSSGNALSSKVFSEPLKSTTLEVFGYYGGSATTTPLKGASPKFTLTLSQTDPVKSQNLISAVNQFWVFLASAASGISPGTAELQCISNTVSTTFSAQVTQVVGQPSAATALALFKSILNPITMYKLVSSCSGNTTSLVSAIFGQTIGRAWTVLNVVKSGFSDLGTAAETFYYWDFPARNYSLCKTNAGGVIAPCVTLQISPSAPSVSVGGTVALTATASNSNGSIPTPPNLQWSSGATSIATVDPKTGVVTGVSAGTATITVTDPASQATAFVTVTIAASSATTLSYVGMPLQSLSVCGFYHDQLCPSGGSINATVEITSPLPPFFTGTVAISQFTISDANQSFTLAPDSPGVKEASMTFQGGLLVGWALEVSFDNIDGAVNNVISTVASNTGGNYAGDYAYYVTYTAYIDEGENVNTPGVWSVPSIFSDSVRTLRPSPLTDTHVRN